MWVSGGLVSWGVERTGWDRLRVGCGGPDVGWLWNKGGFKEIVCRKRCRGGWVGNEN